MDGLSLQEGCMEEMELGGGGSVVQEVFLEEVTYRLAIET